MSPAEDYTVLMCVNFFQSQRDLPDHSEVLSKCSITCAGEVAAPVHYEWLVRIVIRHTSDCYVFCSIHNMF